jgi:hypothetical protein
VFLTLLVAKFKHWNGYDYEMTKDSFIGYRKSKNYNGSWIQDGAKTDFTSSKTQIYHNFIVTWKKESFRGEV